MNTLTSSDRVKLIHKGNALFNNQQYHLAERIFITTNYIDGITRLGEHYFNSANYFRAAELFRKANNLKGEYSCYLKQGLITSIEEFNDLKSRKNMDDKINKKLAKTIQVMLSSKPNAIFETK